ncbi:phosphotransferase family protein [Limnobacter sp.]|uniref:phosphotransferase family protein n=1 Tax=Limnobacter sp. TaxID=2003368 RepID=UPI003511823F
MSASQSVIDQGGAVRPGEELNVGAVTGWLRTQGVEVDDTVEVTQFSGGASNWTYRLKYPQADLILRRPPKGTKAKGAHDMGREHRIQSMLKPIYPGVPTMVGHCSDESLIGSEFYVMHRIEGIILRKHMPRGLALDARQTRTLCTNVWNKLIELHQVDIHSSGLEALSKGEGYTRRQLDGWSQRFDKARTWNVSSFKKVRRWLNAHCPGDVKLCMIHNDWRLDNVVLNPNMPTEVIGVLDWELATVGDPLMDLGSALAYWVQADDNFLMKMLQRQPSSLPGMMTRREIVEHYLKSTGLSTNNWAFYEVFGLFRLAVIAQQIYYRYHHKQTRNPAFKNFWIMVNYFDWRCKQLIKQSGV